MSPPPTDKSSDAISTTQSEYEETATQAGSQAASAAHGWGFWLIYIAAWLCTLALIVVAGLRIGWHDATYPLIWLNAFTRYIYLPAYACLAWSAWYRRWALVLANVVVVSLHIVWLAPDFLRDRRFDSPTSQSPVDAALSPHVRIFFANVNGYNTNYDSMLGEIKSVNADVIILVEFGPPWQKAFHQSPIIAAYPYGSGLKQAYIGNVNVFSRLPLKSETEEHVFGRTAATIEIPVWSQTLRIIGLHAPRPLGTPNNDYAGYWNHFVPKLLAEQGPLVVIGDCDTTQYSLVYKRLTANRLRSAHEDRGRGYATSWPNGQYLLPPIRIDQAFLSPEVECLGISEGEGVGSDHKPIILDVRVRDHQ